MDEEEEGLDPPGALFDVKERLRGRDIDMLVEDEDEDRDVVGVATPRRSYCCGFPS